MQNADWRSQSPVTNSHFAIGNLPFDSSYSPGSSRYVYPFSPSS